MSIEMWFINNSNNALLQDNKAAEIGFICIFILYCNMPLMICRTKQVSTVIKREKSLEERLISGGDKNLSWQEGREEKTFLDLSRKQKQFVSKKRHSLLGSDAGPSCAPVNSLRCCFTDKSEAGLPIRRVLYQSPRRPMAENIERNLPLYQSTVEEASRNGYLQGKEPRWPRCAHPMLWTWALPVESLKTKKRQASSGMAWKRLLLPGRA